MSRPDRRPRPARRGPQRRPSTLAELSKDPAYLELKERLGEPLSPDERALLDAARSAPPPKRAGGGP